MPTKHHTHQFRVRYSETDQMGTFYNARVLEWFECGRTEHLRMTGLPYTVFEQRGVFLPVIEAHATYKGRARYDDCLEMETWFYPVSPVRLKFEVRIKNLTSQQLIVEGHTVHAYTNQQGKPIRPPEWLITFLEKESEPT